MATTKQIDIFGQLKGLDFHLALEPTEGESGMEVLVKAVDYLVSKGATARPLPGRGGSKGREPLPDKCPDCGSSLVSKDWISKDNKPFKIFSCSKGGENHFKRFVPAA